MNSYARKLENALNEILTLPTDLIADAYLIAGEALAARFHGETENDINGIPLRCNAVGDDIDMGIGMSVLRSAAEQHPEFWDGARAMPSSEVCVSDFSVPNIKITDVQEFANAVVTAINEEDEYGSTLLTRMIDEAIAKAVESGCGGVEHAAELKFCDTLAGAERNGERDGQCKSNVERKSGLRMPRL